MDFSLSHEQVALAESVSAMLAKLSPLDVVRAVGNSETGFHHELWQTATGLGLTGLAVPEQYGGAGAGLVELCVVQEQLGASLAPVPYWSTVLAGLVISRHAPADLQRLLLPWIAGQGLRAAVQLTGDPEDVELAEGGAGLVASGRVAALLDGQVADLLLVPARFSEHTVLALVELGGNAQRSRVSALDPTRAFASVRFERERAHIVAPFDALPDVRSLAATLLAAEQAGIGRSALAMSVDYAGLRHQFGRPIGTNQAVKHRCADMFVAVETAWSAAYYAAWAGDHEPAGFDTAATVARLVASDGARFATASAVQVHGGIGFTWEHDAHLFLKRATSCALILGDPHRELDGLAEQLLATDSEKGVAAWI